MDRVQHKLFQFETQPPAKMWDRIERALEVEEEPGLSEKLLNYKTTPPAHMWEKIETGLPKNEATVIPFRRRFSKVFRYGSAAAVLIVAAFLFISKKHTDESFTNTANVGQQGTPALKQNALEIPNDLAGANSVQAEEATPTVEASGEKNFHPRSPDSLPRKSAIASFKHTDEIIIPKNIPVVKSDMPERYIVFSKASGEAVRLSKKLFDLFACADDTENCRENIEFAQQQMASPEAAASADFGGVLELLQNMNHQ
jgi:hypothetical protein